MAQRASRRSTEAGALSTESYKGVRDFYPRDMFLQNYMFGVMSNTAESFGFEEYSASLLEPAELYSAKSSEEIVNEQTYTFQDRGGRGVTLRPEMTPTVARLVAAKRRDLAFPLRWYSIPNVFRYERPQRGRLREHWQLNCDIFGARGIEADVEIVALAYAIMQGFGAREEHFAIRVNNRPHLMRSMDEWGLSADQQGQLFRLLDRKNKIDDFDEQVRAISPTIPLPFELPLDPELQKLLSMLADLSVCNVTIDPSIVRGFEYYTGIVFEVFDTDPKNPRSLFGGGRYDNLLDIFGQEPVPALGFGMGDVTMRDFLETHGLLPDYESSTDLFIATASEGEIHYAQGLARQLRNDGLNVAVNLLPRKLGDQLKAADKKGIAYVLIVGEREIDSGQFTLKHLASGSEQTVPPEDILEVLFSSPLAADDKTSLE